MLAPCDLKTPCDITRDRSHVTTCDLLYRGSRGHGHTVTQEKPRHTVTRGGGGFHPRSKAEARERPREPVMGQAQGKRVCK